MSAIQRIIRDDPTDAEISQFIKEFDEGKHPLSDADKDALATSGFRQYLRASIENAELRQQVERLRASYHKLEVTALEVASQEKRDRLAAEAARDHYREVVKQLGAGLRDAVMFIEAQYVDWDKFRDGNADYDPNYKPAFPPIVGQLNTLLARCEGEK